MLFLLYKFHIINEKKNFFRSV